MGERFADVNIYPISIFIVVSSNKTKMAPSTHEVRQTLLEMNLVFLYYFLLQSVTMPHNKQHGCSHTFQNVEIEPWDDFNKN